MTEPFATLKSLYLDQTQSVMKLKLAHWRGPANAIMTKTQVADLLCLISVCVSWEVLKCV